MIRDPDHITSQHVVVLAADVTIPVRRALGYVRLLHTEKVTSAHLDTDADQRDRILRNWDPDFGELQILESPYRGLTRPLVRYVRRLRRDADPGVLIHVVIPEFVVPGFWSQILHNQTAFAIKASLIFEPGVAVTSIPWHLASAEPRPLNGQPSIAASRPISVTQRPTRVGLAPFDRSAGSTIRNSLLSNGGSTDGLEVGLCGHFEPLSHLDASFLALESATTHMHVGAVVQFEAAGLKRSDGGIDINRIKAHIRGKLKYIPRYRQRLAYVPATRRPGLG